MRVLIADDHAVVRRGLREILQDHFQQLVVGEATNAAETIDAIRQQHWDILLLDLKMPGRGGFEVLREVRATQPKLPVLVLTVQPIEQYGLRAMKAGAAGYITKENAPDELIAAVKKIIDGGLYVPSQLGDVLATRIAPGSTTPPHETLSDREFQVLSLLASGRTIKQVALELSLSIKTVSTYRARLLTKLNLKSTADLVRYGQLHGLGE